MAHTWRGAAASSLVDNRSEPVIGPCLLLMTRWLNFAFNVNSRRYKLASLLGLLLANTALGNQPLVGRCRLTL